MNPETRQLNAWIPARGYALRKAGVQFDAVRVDAEDGRRLAEVMESLTGGDPGPIVQQANGARSTYFFLPVHTTRRRVWPPGMTVFNAASAATSYVPVPALNGHTWPLTWFAEPTAPGRFVHPLLLRHAALDVLGRSGRPPGAVASERLQEPRVDGEVGADRTGRPW